MLGRTTVHCRSLPANKASFTSRGAARNSNREWALVLLTITSRSTAGPRSASTPPPQQSVVWGPRRGAEFEPRMGARAAYDHEPLNGGPPHRLQHLRRVLYPSYMDKGVRPAARP